MKKVFIVLALLLSAFYFIQGVSIIFGYEPSTFSTIFAYLTCSIAFLGMGLESALKKN